MAYQESAPSPAIGLRYHPSQRCSARRHDRRPPTRRASSGDFLRADEHLKQVPVADSQFVAAQTDDARASGLDHRDVITDNQPHRMEPVDAGGIAEQLVDART